MTYYKVLINYGSEGWQFVGTDPDGDNFLELDEAVKVAQENSYGSKFLIIEVVDWEAKEKVK
jgi:hypothetical protein